MNFKVLSVAALLISTVCFSGVSIAQKAAEKMPETPQQKEERIEANLTFLFKEAINASALELEKDHEMAPFTVLMKKDGTMGYFNTGGKNKGMSIEQQSASIRALLIDMARTKQIDASVQAMYATITDKKGKNAQGLMFEIEHREGIAMMRFLPVSEVEDENGKKTGKLWFDLKRMSTSAKPRVIFPESIVAQAK